MAHTAQAYPSNGSNWHSRFSRAWLATIALLLVTLVYLGSSSTRQAALGGERVDKSYVASKLVTGHSTIKPEEERSFDAHPLTLVNPRYNVLVLRSILQHSNTSWQDTPLEAKGHFVQSLIWLQMINGLRPTNPGKYMSAACTFGDYPAVSARIHPFDLHPGDRTTGHGFVFYVDCQLPDSLQSTTHDLPEITVSLEMEMGTLTTPTLPDFQVPLLFKIGTKDVPLELTPPMVEKTEFAVCLSPLTYTWQDLPLWNLIEWRMHYARLGVERVNWYGRDPTFQRFIDMYTEKRGGSDTFLLAPSLVEYPGHFMQPWEIYADQDAWYMDCILRNAFSSDFILIIDTDEFIMPDFRLDNPWDQFKDFMRGIGKDKGTIEFDRIAMARPYELREPDFYENLIQLQFDCYNRKDMKTTKTLYRANSVLGVHQHLQRKMYPMPPDVAAEVMPKATSNQRYGWHLQHSYQDEIWPKLFHYRWWGVPEYDVCTRPSYLEGMPKYVEYLKELRMEVAELAKYMDAKYPLEVEALGLGS